MSRKVKHLKAHSSLFIPGLGNLTDSLPNQSKSLPGLEMVLRAEGVEVKCKNICALIPLANIQMMVLDPEEAATAGKKE
jgi:hypothetical protein